MLGRLALVTLLIACPGIAAANIVNVQGSLAKEPEEGWTGSATAIVDWRTGNTDLIQVGGSTTAIYRRGRVLGLGIVRGEYARGEGTLLAQHVFEHARVRVGLDTCRRWMWEAFGQHELDEFRRLAVRAVAGTGPALRVLDEAHVGAVIGAAYMAEYERFDRAEAADAGDRHLNHRISTYATGVFKVDDKVSVGATVYLQPRIDEPSDLRFFSESSVTTALRQWLALQTAFVVAYDRSPPIGIEPLDTQVRTTMTVSW